MPDSIPLPEWIVTSLGDKIPFDLDRISQSLFAASEALGRSNAFLARELTDAAGHFLALEFEGRTPTTQQVADTVAKVLRELGQKELAQAYLRRRERQRPVKPAVADNPFLLATREATQSAVQRWLNEQGLHAIFSRDLLAAQDAGLLLLGDQSAPGSIASGVVDGGQLPLDPLAALLHLQAWSRSVSRSLILDSPEWTDCEEADPQAWQRFCAGMLASPRLLGREVAANLNAARPPAWAAPKPLGPLFATDPASDPAINRLPALLDPGDSPAWNVHWHLQARDFAAGPQRAQLLKLVEAKTSTTFAFDRSKETVSLGEGVDRQHPGVMLEVGLSLPTFLRMDGIASQADRFLEKLPTLARMAASAGAQKRRYLRQHSEDSLLTRQFLLDRVNVVVVPLGLDEVVQTVTGQRPAGSPLSLNFAKQIVQTLSDSLAEASRAQHLNLALDSAGDEIVRAATMEALRDECVAAGKLHAIAGAGTLTLAKPDATAADVVELLAFVWRKTHVQRLRFVSSE